MTSSPFLGELAAILTAFCWTITAIAFEASGKRIGSLAVNLIRLVIALAFLSLFSYFRFGYAFPMNATSHQWMWLVISGIIGFSLGDMALFQAFVIIGARISLLIMSLVPPLAALLSWIFLHEILGWMNFMGMMLTIAGIALVIVSREPKGADGIRKKINLAYSWQGILLAFGGAIGQAGGLVMSKHGMQDYDAFSASQIRVFAGMIGFAVMFSFWRKWSRVWKGLKNYQAMKLVTLGAFFGPFLGVSFSLLAVQHTNTGVASTIMSITPVIIIPASVFFFKEKLKTKEIIGAALAVMGVAIFFI